MSNPQTNDVANPQPLWQVNAKWVNGIAPGYWPTAGSGLTLNLSAGAALLSGAIFSYAGGTLSLANGATNFIYLDTSNSCVPTSNTTGFRASDIPIAVVVTVSGTISTITDDRTFFEGPNPGGVNIISGSSHTLIASDFAKLVAMTSASSTTMSLDSSLGSRFCCAVYFVSNSVLTPTSGTINGLSSLNISAGSGGWLFFDGTNWEAVTGGGGAQGVVLGFIINNGTPGTNIGPMLQLPRAGTFSKAVIITKASDPTIPLTVRIKKNGVDIFTSDPTVAAGTASGTVSSSSSFTSVPLNVLATDVFSFDITQGSAAWQFTFQVET